MRKKDFFILLSLCIFFLLSANICLAQRAAYRQAPAEVQQASILELKNIGMMIANGEPEGKYLAVWKQLVSRSRNMDINRAVNIVIDEAKLEANRNVDLHRSVVQKYDTIKRNINREIGVIRLILSRSTGRIQPIQENIYILERRNPAKFIVRKGNIINKRSELENYINYLQRILNEVGDDAQLANVDMQNALQKQQQLLAMVQNFAKLLFDSQMEVIRKIGG